MEDVREEAGRDSKSASSARVKAKVGIGFTILSLAAGGVVAAGAAFLLLSALLGEHMKNVPLPPFTLDYVGMTTFLACPVAFVSGIVGLVLGKSEHCKTPLVACVALSGLVFALLCLFIWIALSLPTH